MEITQQDRNEALACWEDGDAIKEVVLEAVTRKIAGFRLLLQTLNEFLVSEHAPGCWCNTLYHRRDGIDSSCERCKIENLLYEIEESQESEYSEPVTVLRDSAARHDSMSGNKPLVFGLPLSQGEIEALDNSQGSYAQARMSLSKKARKALDAKPRSTPFFIQEEIQKGFDRVFWGLDGD